MIHSIGYLGPYDPNIGRLVLNSNQYVRYDGTTGNIDEPSDKADGIFFGYLEKPKRQFFAVRANFREHRVNLENPVLLDRSRHTDGKGFFKPPQFGDVSATNLLAEMIATNPSQTVELTNIGTQCGLL
jgi:hypothetical protein